jgi:hypothetical protein
MAYTFIFFSVAFFVKLNLKIYENVGNKKYLKIMKNRKFEATLATQNFVKENKYTGCLKIREFQIQSVVGDHFSSPNMKIKKKSGLLPQRYIGLKVHSLKCVLCKYRLKSSVFIIIYGVDDYGKQ